MLRTRLFELIVFPDGNYNATSLNIIFRSPAYPFLLHSTFGKPPFHKYYGNFVKKAFSEAKEPKFCSPRGLCPRKPPFPPLFPKVDFQKRGV
jgi:hypothetical protein